MSRGSAGSTRAGGSGERQVTIVHCLTQANTVRRAYGGRAGSHATNVGLRTCVGQRGGGERALVRTWRPVDEIIARGSGPARWLVIGLVGRWLAWMPSESGEMTIVRQRWILSVSEGLRHDAPLRRKRKHALTAKEPRTDRRPRWEFVALGIAMGLIIGQAQGNIALGLPVGVGFGMALAFALPKR